MRSAFEVFVEAISWFRIVLSPTLLAVLVSLPIYFVWPSMGTAIFSALLILAGLVAGIFWARRITKKERVSTFLARVSSNGTIRETIGEKKD
ncbi:MAG: hypothetical protein ACRCYO_08880 [Bacteroidia bacterium]